ncbi:MAG: sulfatase-like hydrolase/transferase [Bryobacterales bacterium]|nr:sulfatase-like hydrolase/transferase [Bryobacterales bacterium]
MKAQQHRSKVSLVGGPGPTIPELRRRLLRRGAVAALLGMAALAPNDASGQAEFFPPDPGIKMADFPNIILITGDHLRWDHVAANGNEAIITPNMDRLAREGTTFLSHFTVGVACAPNRASLMTGRYPHSHGVMSNGIKMPQDEMTLTHVLRDAGYYTGQMGKLHFWPHKDRDHREAHPPYGFHQMRLSDEPGPYDDAYGRWLWAQGKDVREKARVTMPGERPRFEHYVFEGDDRTTHASWVATETITFIEDTLQRHPDRPFFVHAGFYAPHPPLNPPASALAKYEGRVLPPRRYADNEVDFLPPKLAATMTSLVGTPEETWDSYRRYFYAMVTHMDENIGRIMAAVEKAGLQNRTLYVVTSDHGDYLGDHNLTSKGARPYDGALRIPLIFRGPGVPTGVSDELVEIVDVMPTLLDMLGIPEPAGNQGISLVPVMAGRKGRDLIYMQALTNRMIRTKRAKYWIDGSGEEVLFDYSNDPDELRNVAQATTHRALLDEMRVSLLKKLIAARDPLPERIRPY